MNLFKERIRKSESKLSDWNEQIMDVIRLKTLQFTMTNLYTLK